MTAFQAITKSTTEHLGAAQFNRPPLPAKRHGFSPPFTAGAPDRGGVYVGDEYHLLLIADLELSINEADIDDLNEDNTIVFSGAYHAAAGPVMVFGNSSSEVIELSPQGQDALQLSFQSDVFTYATADVSDVRVRCYEGDDLFRASSPAGTASTPLKVWGGDGADTITGGRGNDILLCGRADDSVTGGDGSDTLSGGTGNDRYLFQPSNAPEADYIYEPSESGRDTFDFSELTADIVLNLGATVQQQSVHTNRKITLYSGNDIEDVIGGSGNDSLTGGAGRNVITGNAGNDTLNGYYGSDTLNGGQGDDTFLFGMVSGSEEDTVNELPAQGRDTLNFSVQSTSVKLNLSSTTLQAVHAGRTLQLNSPFDFENLVGGSGADYLTGGPGANILDGNGGHDTLNGFYGSDTLNGGPGDDTYLFGAVSGSEADNVTELIGQGKDTLNFASQSIPVRLNLGSTAVQPVHVGRTLKLSSSAGLENVMGGSAADFLTGGSGANVLAGNGGPDTLNGFYGNDTLNGGPGDDTYVFGTVSGSEADAVNEHPNQGSDTLNFAAQAIPVSLNLSRTIVQLVHVGRSLKINSSAGFENAIGGAAADFLTGGSGANVLIGNRGSDTLNGFTGNDTLRGGLGDDTYNFGTAASAEADVVEEFLNEGADTLNFAALNTPVSLNLGRTTVQTVHTNRTLLINLANTFENVTGGAAADVIRGNSLNNILTGNGGSDLLTGLNGNDILTGSTGNDIIVGGRGADAFNAGQGEDLLIAGYTVSSAVEDSESFLQTIRTSWIGGGSFTTRRAALTSILVPASRLFNDADVDTLTSSLDLSLDWIFASVADGVTKDVGDILTLL